MKELILKVGDELCLTPPMGWSSWYSYSEAVGQDNVLKTARLFVERGLVNHGWAYINIDDCWQGRRGGKYGAIQPNKRFPDMKAMCDAIHAMGMKVGIYSTPWMGTYAGFIGGSAPNAKSDYGEMAIPEEERKQEDQIFGSYPGVHRRKADHVGAVWLFDRDAKQWADWGFDYVKVDWNPNDVSTTKRIRKALDESGQGYRAQPVQCRPVRTCGRAGQAGEFMADDGGYPGSLGQRQRHRFFPGTLAEAYAPGTLE